MSYIVGPVDGPEIRRRRQRRGIKTSEFAQRVGLHRSSLVHIEIGTRRPSLEVLHRIATALDCDVIELLRHDVPDEVSA